MTLCLEDVHALVRSFGLVEDGHCYMGKLDAKREEHRRIQPEAGRTIRDGDWGAGRSIPMA